MEENESINDETVLKTDESILLTIKKMLGITPYYEQFDVDIIIHINTALSALSQIAKGLKSGFTIKDKNSCWHEYTTDSRLLDPIKNYVYLKTRLVFDPPTSSIVTESIKEMIRELECRIQIAMDSDDEEGN